MFWQLFFRRPAERICPAAMLIVYLGDMTNNLGGYHV